MNVRPIRNEDDYDWALTEVAQYFENEPDKGTPDGDRFEILLALIGKYEDEHWPIEPADPVETLKQVMEARDLAQKDLAELLGSRPRASEILSRKRHLTVGMVHAISKAWKIPAEALVQPYHLAE